jgi:hypothetical protein
VQIVGLQHDESEIRFLPSNTSEKSVVAVAISRVDLVPLGCSTEPRTGEYWPVKNFSPVGFKLNIVPQGKGIAAKAGIQMIGTPRPSPSYPHLPTMVVDMAKWAKAGYVQVQFGITGVLFEDGTSWPAQIASFLRDDFDSFRTPSPDEVTTISALYHSHPFDPLLVEVEEGKCTDAATVASALQSMKEIVFDHESPEASDPDDDRNAPPHLRFSCSLEGPKAVCRLPLETDHSVAKPRSEAAEKR